MAKQLALYAKHGGVQALRLGHLYDGASKEVPPLEIYTLNEYKKHGKVQISLTQIENIINLNSFDIHPKQE